MRGHQRRGVSVRVWGLVCLLGVLAACGEGTVGEVPESEAGLVEQDWAHGSCEPGEVRWWRQSSGPGEENLFHGAVDRWGNSILLGTYTGPADFGGGPLPVPESSRGLFIASYSPGGKHRWSAAYLPSAELDELGVFPYDLVTDERGNITFLVVNPELHRPGGETLPAGISIVQLSREGALRWSRRIAEPGEGFPSYGLKLAVDRSGHIILSGAIAGEFDFGGGLRDGFEASVLARYTRDGEYLWDRVFQGTEDNLFSAATTDSHGNIYAAGFFLGSVSYGGKRFTSAEAYSSVLVKFSPSGRHLWSRVLSSSGRFTHVAVHGNRVVVASPHGRPLAFGGKTFLPPPGEGPSSILLAYTRSGEERWGRPLDASVDDFLEDDEEGLLVSGSTRAGSDLGTGPLPGDPDSSVDFVARYDWRSGEVESVRILPMGLPLAVNWRGELFVARSFQVPLDIGSRTLTPDLIDTLLMRLCP